MEKLKSLLKFAAGGLGAIVSIAMLAGCSDEEPATGQQVKVTKADIEACCGTDDGSKTHETCVEYYRTNGVCSHPIKDDPPVYYGPPVYGPPDIPSDAQLKACCEDRDDGLSSSACMVEYKMTMRCPPLVYAEYGMPEPSEAELKACCDNRKDGMDPDACREQYRNTFSCPEDWHPAPVYGMPEPTEEELKACCDSRMDGMNPDVCRAAYEQSYRCPELQIPPAPLYGMPEPTEPTEEELKACCENRMDGMDPDECMTQYVGSYQCPKDDPVISYYGMMFNAVLTDTGFDMDYYGTMNLHFVPAE